MLSSPINKKSKQPYAQLYLLDSASNYRHVSGLVEFLVRNQRIPPTLVIGINNSDRNKDFYSPPCRPENSNSTQSYDADNFINFLTIELMPWVDKNYDTHPLKVLIGQSAGGYFALYTLLTKSSSFDAYIIADPSVWWNEYEIVKRGEEVMSKGEQITASVFISDQNRGGPGLAAVDELNKIAASTEIRWHHNRMLNETHGTIAHRTIHDGLEFVFDGWMSLNVLSLYDEGGISRIYKHHDAAMSRLRYKREYPKRMFHLLFAELVFSGRLEEAEALIESDEIDFLVYGDEFKALAEAYLEKGNSARAIYHYKNSLRITSGNSEIRRKLAEFGVDPNNVVSQDDLRRLEGHYRMPWNSVFEFRVMDYGLYLVPPVGPPTELWGRGNNEYWYFDSHGFRFNLDESGNIKSLIVKEREKPWAPATKVEVN